MIDLYFLREHPHEVAQLIHKKDPSFDVAQLIALDGSVRTVRTALELLRAQKNELARQARGGVTPEIREQSIALDKQIHEQDTALERSEREFKQLYLRCPNLPQDDVPVGNKESNRVIKTVGEKPAMSWVPKHHMELAALHDWFEMQQAATITGSGFVLYKDQGVSLIYALAMFMLKNNKKHGYRLMLPPDLVSYRSLEVASNFPRFIDQVYAMPADDLYLSPTSEVGLTNVYRDHIFRMEELPTRMTAWTSCFRREAGGYGATERGLIRIHQFEKVELYTLCTPENSEQEHERMLACAEDILQQLGLHYRVSLLAGQDCSFASSKTYDIEVWLPGQGIYCEVSSISNCSDFQARRGALRYKEGSKTRLVHTLNGSSLALPRLMVALMETYQQEDGTITLPDILTKSEFFI